VAGHEAFGEVLRAFELGGFPGRTEDLQTAVAKNIDDAGGERRFGTDYREMDLVLCGEVSERFRVGDVDVFEFTLAGRAGVAGGDEDLLQTGGLRQPPGECVLATAGADDH
jgi:hypothetical protein